MRRFHRRSRLYLRRSAWARLLLAVLFLILAAFWVNSRLEPVVEDLTANEARARAVQVISAAVEESLAGQDQPAASMVDIQYKETGEIASLSTDMAEMNSLKASLLADVQEELGESVHIDLGVPMVRCWAVGFCMEEGLRCRCALHYPEILKPILRVNSPQPESIRHSTSSICG